MARSRAFPWMRAGGYGLLLLARSSWSTELIYPEQGNEVILIKRAA
jgi:hypothetical protein